MARSWPALDICPVSDLLEAALTDLGVTAIHEGDDGDWRVFFTSPDERDRALALLRDGFPRVRLASVDVADDDWAARSQASLGAVRAGRVTVAPPWDVPDPAPGDLTIVIQPSMGFGTGHHATTRLCLVALQRLDLRGRRVVDVGTGSGVLAIAASLLGARDAIGFDDDRDAIAAAAENLAMNPAAAVTLDVDDLRTTREEPADVVVANLTGGLLIAAAAALQQLVAPGGRLVLSGLLASEEPGVRDAFAGRTVEHRGDEDGWICLTLR